MTISLLVKQFWRIWVTNRAISQIPECTCPISHTDPFRTQMRTFLFWMQHCGIWNRCILGFVNKVNLCGYLTTMRPWRCHAIKSDAPLLVVCEGIRCSPLRCGPFGVFFVVNLNNLLNKQSTCPWFGASWSSCGFTVMLNKAPNVCLTLGLYYSLSFAIKLGPLPVRGQLACVSVRGRCMALGISRNTPHNPHSERPQVNKPAAITPYMVNFQSYIIFIAICDLLTHIHPYLWLNFVYLLSY